MCGMFAVTLHANSNEWVKKKHELHAHCRCSFACICVNNRRLLASKLPYLLNTYWIDYVSDPDVKQQRRKRDQHLLPFIEFGYSHWILSVSFSFLALLVLSVWLFFLAFLFVPSFELTWYCSNNTSNTTKKDHAIRWYLDNLQLASL